MNEDHFYETSDCCMLNNEQFNAMFACFRLFRFNPHEEIESVCVLQVNHLSSVLVLSGCKLVVYEEKMCTYSFNPNKK